MSNAESQGFESARQRHLSFARENSDYNRRWFQELRAQVQNGAPFAYINADIVPTEIFKAMDIPVVVNQWWGSVISAKQKSAEYMDRLNAAGYARHLCRYCSLGYAGTLEPDPAAAPWGGLPSPTVVVTGDICNSNYKIAELWARRFNAPLFRIESAALGAVDIHDWNRRHRHEWESMLGRRSIDLLTGQYQELIAFLERHTGRRFDAARFRRIMELVNEQEEFYFQTRELINRTRPAPLNIADQMPATMIPQWHRGTEWARDRARLFYEETRRKVDDGIGVVGSERARLMWIGTGLWYNLDFYQHFEQRYGAVFIWSIYLSVAADAYPTYGDEPLRALAGRMMKINNLISVPPFNTQWYAEQIRAAGIDGVVMIGREHEDGCQSRFGTQYLVEQAIEGCGVPLLRLGIDNADARSWNETEVTDAMNRFLEQEVLPRQSV